MLKKQIFIIFLAVICASCSGIKPEEMKVLNLVTAKDIKNGPTGIADVFPLEKRVYAYITLSWDDFDKKGGRREFLAKWYNGEKLVAIAKAPYYLQKPPAMWWASMTGVALGAGKCHVEIYMDDVLMASKNFEIDPNLKSEQEPSETKQ